MKKTIGILAHVDGGKTTFSEQLLYHTNSIRNRGRVDHKNSYLDNNEIEKDRGITIYSEVGKFSIENQEYYLIDTPGHIDFSPEMERAISVLDYAILIISAVEGVQGHSETIWELLNKYKVPTFIFINKIDREGAEVNKVINEMKHKLSEDIIFFSSELEDETIEEVVERDEDLLNLYLEGNLSEEELLNKIAKESDFYDLSTDLLFFLNIRNSSKNINSKDYIVKIRNKNNNLSKNTDILDKDSINDFYLKIRNVVNHGGKIKQNVDVNKIILKCLDSVEKFIKEG